MAQLTGEVRSLNVEQDTSATHAPGIVRLRAAIEGLDTACIPFAVQTARAGRDIHPWDHNARTFAKTLAYNFRGTKTGRTRCMVRRD